MTERHDVIIIGTGAGGGTLAWKLARAGKRVLLLERGTFLPREKANWDPAAVFLENRYHTRETWLDARGRDLHPGTGYWVGGNTKVYGAALFRLRERDFELVRHKDGISPEWPLKYADFEPFYTEAERLYEVHGRQGMDPTEPFRSGEYPHPPISDEDSVAELRGRLLKQGLRPFFTPLALMLDEANRPASRCIRCDTCDAFPCLVHAKADAEVNCVRRILHLPNVTLLTGARVTKLLTGPSGRTITGVEASVGGRQEVFAADVVALCAGAINSAALLLRSASDKHPAGLANGSGQVGRNFMFHQADTILAVRLKRVPGNYLKTLSVNDFYFGDRDYPFPMGNIQPLGSVKKEMIRTDAPFFAPDAALAAIARRSMPWWLTTEDLPDPDNRVRLEGGTIRIDYRDNNVEPFRRLRDRWVSILKEAGHASHWFSLSAYLKKRVGVEGVGHQNGTCRFGRDPATSVLDVNCRAHEVDNLYVVDASFFPSCGAVNPALTVIANALRVGQHLIERLGGAKETT